MNLLFVGAQYSGFHAALFDAGHEVTVLDYWRWFLSGDGPSDTGVVNGWWQGIHRPLTQDEVNERVIKAVKEVGPDAVIVFKGWMDGNRFIRTSTLKECVLETDCKVIYWSVDDPDFVPFWRHYMARENVWNMALTCCRASLSDYARAGVPARYFLPGFDSRWPISDSIPPPEPAIRSVAREVVDVVIVGTPYWEVTGADVARAKYALGCLRRGWTVEVYGPKEWIRDTHEEARRRHGREVEPFVCGSPLLEPVYKGWVQHDNVWGAFMRAKVVFNNHLRKGGGYDPKKYDGYVNDKVPQIGGVGGGAQLMDYQPGISPEVLTVGKEFECYGPHTNPKEGLKAALDATEKLLTDNDRRKELAKAARERVLREHTWDVRAKELEEIINSL